MSRFALIIPVALLLAVSSADRAAAERVVITPFDTQDNSTNDLEFEWLAMTPDGTKIVTVGNFNPAHNGAERHSLYSIPLPPTTPNPTVPTTQLSTNNFSLVYDVDNAPVISPNGSTVLIEHNGIGGTNTIFQVPITGEGSTADYNGIFEGTNANNRVLPGLSNGNPQYSPNGNTIFFLNFNSGFGGTVPSISGDNSFRGAASWNQIYSVPAAGGTPTPITLSGNGTINAGGGSIDRDLWAVTPNGSSIVYAPDVPLVAHQTAGDRRTKLFSVPTTGGTPTEIPLTPSTLPGFSIARQLEVTPDGSKILFIGDYETPGRQELFSVPITGGIPTRINDNLAFAGDVKSFKISPDGTKVAYAAGQNVSANTELFLKNLNGAPGSSIRVSEAPAANDGRADVAESSGDGHILFSNDGNRLFHRGDMLHTTDVGMNGIFALYEVDATAKGGLVPSAYTYVGPTGGDFFDENNWRDAQNNAPPSSTIEPGVTIAQSLIIDGDQVSAAGIVNFVQGGSLEMTTGSVLNITGVGGGGGQNGFITQDGAGLKMTDAQLLVASGLQLAGEHSIIDSTVRAAGAESDLYFDQISDSFISGSTLFASDIVGFEKSMPTIVDSDIETGGAFSLKFESEISIRDTVIDTTGGEIQAASDDRGDNTLLRLLGASEVTGTALWDGVSAFLDDSSVLTLTGTSRGHIAYRGDGDVPFPADKVGTITLASTDAQLFLNGDENPQDLGDIRNQIINGLTGLTYAQDPNAWNVTDWNGMDAIGLLQLVGGPSLDGDFDDDDDVDGHDFLAWQRGEAPGGMTPANLQLWRDNFGASSSAAAAATAVPEPSAGLLALACGLPFVTLRKRGL